MQYVIKLQNGRILYPMDWESTLQEIELRRTMPDVYSQAVKVFGSVTDWQGNVYWTTEGNVYWTTGIPRKPTNYGPVPTRYDR